MERDPRTDYDVLGLEPGASESQIRAAFRMRAAQCHPDRGGNADEYRRVTEAQEKLLAYLKEQGDESPPPPPDPDELSNLAEQLGVSLPPDASTALDRRAPSEVAKASDLTGKVPMPRRRRGKQPRQVSQGESDRPPDRPATSEPASPSGSPSLPSGQASSTSSPTSAKTRVGQGSLEDYYAQLKGQAADDRAQWSVYAAKLREIASHPEIAVFLKIMRELGDSGTSVGSGWAIGGWDAASTRDVGMTVFLQPDGVVTLDRWTPEQLETGRQSARAFDKSMRPLSATGIRFYYGSLEATLREAVKFAVKVHDRSGR